MNRLTLIARILLGLVFTVFGLNGFLQFMPQPDVPPDAGAFLGALAATGYLFPVLKLTEVAAGVALLTGRFVPLALTVLAPVVLNIVLFHAVLAPGGLPVALLAAGLGGYLAYAYRDSFSGVLRSDAVPADAADHRREEEPSPAE